VDYSADNTVPGSVGANPLPSFDPPPAQKPPADKSSAEKPRRQIAVALQYDLGGTSLPRVVANGKGAVAEQIIQLAFANGVKVREDPDLAQLLSVVELDTEIPAEALVAVAEILAYVYRANGKLPPRQGPV
jgi:flagellar biosynthesis protein